MTSRELFAVAAMVGGCALSFPATALADDNTVTYEVLSKDVATANVEYFDGSANQSEQGVTLPWKLDAKVGDLSRGAKANNHANLQADWTGDPSETVTVRITYKDKVLCQNTLDTGHASCDFTTFWSQRDPAATPAS